MCFLQCAASSLLSHDTCMFCDPSVLNNSRHKFLFCHTRMGEPSLEQVLQEALRQYEKQARIYAAARQSRPEHNRHVAAQVTKMVIEKRREWSKLTSLNDLTLARRLQFAPSCMTTMMVELISSNVILKFAVEGREREPSIGLGGNGLMCNHLTCTNWF